MKKTTGYYFRIIHRYLGFFLVGVMSMYAISGIVLTYRNTDWLKKKELVEKTIEPGLSDPELAEELKIRRFKTDRVENGIHFFSDGTYNSATGEVSYTYKYLPKLLNNMNNIHKATSTHPLYWLNIFSGIALLFFVISSFWMFIPSSSIFRKGLLFALGGLIITLILLYV